MNNQTSLSKNENVLSFQSEEFGTIRTVVINNETWFVGKDVANALGYAKPRNAIETHVDEEDKKGAPIQGNLGGAQQMTIINESGLYSLTLSSKLPSAKTFKRWVTSEVLPSIRKTGGYYAKIPKTFSEALRLAADQQEIIEEQKKLIEEQQKQLEENEPDVAFSQAVVRSSDCILIGHLAKMIAQNGVDIGQNRLFKWMRDHNYLGKHGRNWNIPLQQWVEQGLFFIEESTVETDFGVHITKTPLVTGKGQKYFINLFLNRK